MYRNSVDITSIEGIEVDAGSLWYLVDGYFILDDQDQHVTHAKTDSFYLVTDQ